jgi:hypothetical protein
MAATHEFGRPILGGPLFCDAQRHTCIPLYYVTHPAPLLLDTGNQHFFGGVSIQRTDVRSWLALWFPGMGPTKGKI